MRNGFQAGPLIEGPDTALREPEKSVLLDILKEKSKEHHSVQMHWLNDAGEVVGIAATPGDASFHATLWRNGVITDLGTLAGDCFSDTGAINSNHQIVGASFNCDTNTERVVLWDRGSIIDLNTLIPANSSLELSDASNINDRGEIAGRGLPPGCDDVHFCGHGFFLIPCDNATTCEDNTGVDFRNSE